MRICITGVAGFVGCNLLADRLIAEGHEVWGMDNFERDVLRMFIAEVDFHEIADCSRGSRVGT